MKTLLISFRFSSILLILLNSTPTFCQTIAAGNSHCLALCSDGTVRAWGSNSSGQLGNGTEESSAIPVTVSNLTEIIAIASGESHCLALKNDGTVWTWGDNIEGQLGDGTTTDNSLPAQIQNFSGVIAIAGGEYHSLALKNDGTVWAWGWNDSGQFGDGTDTDSNIPKLVSELSYIDVIAMAAGSEHSVFLRSNGQVLTCGNNYHGQLGNSTNIDSNLPTQVGVAFTDVIAVSAYGNNSMLLKTNGIVFAWGDNFFGQLGDGTTIESNFPLQVNQLTNVIAISAGENRSIALKSNGNVASWGTNSNGELGNGTNMSSNFPVDASLITNVVAIAAGENHTVALKNDGSVYTWGSNGSGALGNNSSVSSNVPINVSPICAIATDIIDYSTSKLFSVFPNPSNGQFMLTFQGSKRPKHAEVFNLQGQMIYSINNILELSTLELDFSGFSKGIYFLKMYDGERFHNEKIVIQ